MGALASKAVNMLVLEAIIQSPAFTFVVFVIGTALMGLSALGGVDS